MIIERVQALEICITPRNSTIELFNSHAQDTIGSGIKW